VQQEPAPAYLLDRMPTRCEVPDGEGRRSPTSMVTSFVNAYCHEHPGVAVILDDIGSREAHSGVAAFVKLDAIKPVRHGRFIASAVVNSVRLTLGEEAGVLASKSMGGYTGAVRSLKQLADIFRQINQQVGIVNTAGKQKEAMRLGRTRSSRNAPFDFFGNLDRGIWILHLQDQRRLDHAICIDCDRKIILDSFEKFALELCPKSLEMCGGGEVKNLRIVDAREVVARRT